MISKKPIRTSQEATELHVMLKLEVPKQFDRATIPGVWVYHEDEQGGKGAILERVTFTDFYGDDIFHRAEQLVQLLTGDHWKDNLPFDSYPMVERAVRNMLQCRNHIGDMAAGLTDDARKAETLYDGMVDFYAIEIMEGGEDRVTVARTYGRNKAYVYKEKTNEMKRMRDQAANLEKSLSKTLMAFQTILAKLRKDYETPYTGQ